MGKLKFHNCHFVEVFYHRYHEKIDKLLDRHIDELIKTYCLYKLQLY